MKIVYIATPLSRRTTAAGTVLFSFDQQRAYEVLGVLRDSVECFVVEIKFGFRYVSERFGVVVAHER